MGFEEYAKTRLPLLLRTARAVCADSGLAEDVVQEVLSRIYARWSDGGGFDPSDAYLRRMVINEYLSWRRKWGRVIPHADPSRLTKQRDSGGTEDFDDATALIAEIRKLPPRQRAVIGLRYFADLDDAAIAERSVVPRAPYECTPRGHWQRCGSLRREHRRPVRLERAR